jgi:Rod binding domain-containing protein
MRKAWFPARRQRCLHRPQSPEPLKRGDRDSEGNMRKVAQEFESLFLSEMLKASRKASDVLADDNPMNSDTAKQYRTCTTSSWP